MVKEELKKKIADLIYNAKWQFEGNRWGVENMWFEHEDEVIEKIIEMVKEDG